MFGDSKVRVFVACLALALLATVTVHAEASKPKKVNDGETAIFKTTLSEADANATVKAYLNSKDLDFTINQESGRIISGWYGERNCGIVFYRCANRAHVRVVLEGGQTVVRVQVFERKRQVSVIQEPWIESSESKGKATSEFADGLEEFMRVSAQAKSDSASVQTKLDSVSARAKSDSALAQAKLDSVSVQSKANSVSVQSKSDRATPFVPVSHPKGWSLCFARVREFDAGNAPWSVCAADFDGDGNQDLAVTNELSGSVSILLNKGGGRFASPVNYAASEEARSVVAADFDGDKDMDLAVAGGVNGTVSVLKNKGDGTFAPPVNYAIDVMPQSVAAADLDGDGDQDLVVANGWTYFNSRSNVSVLKNNGDGTFAAALHFGVGPQPSSELSTLTPSGNPASVFAADLDGDGHVDLAVANFGNSISVLKNNGNGTFLPPALYVVARVSKSVIAADFDDDGNQDLAVGCTGGTISVLRNNGDGTFAPAANYAAGTSPSSIFAVDLNGDAWPDLVVANAGYDPKKNNVSVLKNNGDGTFAAAVNYAADNDPNVAPNTEPYSVIAADLNKDGIPDLAVAKHGSGNVSVLINCGKSGMPPRPKKSPH